MQVAHDILVSAHHKDAEIIDFSGHDAMKRQRFLHILEVDKLRNFAIGIACDIHDRSLAIGRRGEAMDWHDGEQLTERPVIEQRLENRKVTDVLVGK